jgi:hypothetical protein
MKINAFQFLIYFLTFLMPFGIQMLNDKNFITKKQFLYLQFVIHASILGLAFKFDSFGLLLNVISLIIVNLHLLYKMSKDKALISLEERIKKFKKEGIISVEDVCVKCVLD